jgi:hypothetical protein
MKNALKQLDTAQSLSSHGERLRAVSSAARLVRDRLLAEAPVVAVRTLPLTTVPYPTRYAFQGAAWSPIPILQMAHRCLLVQFHEDGELRTLLFNPSDIIANRATPFFADFIRFVGPLESLFADRAPPLEAQLAQLGLGCGDIDYIAFDHFHTQDLRPLLGTLDGSLQPRFPRATLLAPRREWSDWDNLHPMQRAWYVPDGKSRVNLDRVQLTDGSLRLGDGLALVFTPGHTAGNQTLFMRTSSGIWGCSENGTSVDNWSPHASRIPGVARFARKFGLEVIINANTPELGAAQYTSMIAERTIVDTVGEAPEMVRMFPSSEVTSSWLAPGTTPTWLHRAITDGAVLSRRHGGSEVQRDRVA